MVNHKKREKYLELIIWIKNVLTFTFTTVFIVLFLAAYFHGGTVIFDINSVGEARFELCLLGVYGTLIIVEFWLRRPN